MSIVHSPASPFGGSPICSFGVGHAPKVLWGYKRQSAVCKSALRAFVPAVCLPFRNNFSSAVGSVKHQSADISSWCLQVACLRCLGVNIHNIHKIHRDRNSPYRYHHRISCSVFLFPKIFFWSFVILTSIIIYLHLLSFIITYRQLFKKCSNSIIPRF